jgi:hypothetical protein
MCLSKLFKKETKWWQLVLAAVLYTVIAEIWHTIGAFVGMSYYEDPNYFSVWSKIMMPVAGPPPAEFYFYSWLFGLIGALLFVLVYEILKSGMPGDKPWRKGMTYGFLVFLVGTIPGYLAMVLLINLPCGLIYYWAVESLLVLLTGGAVVGKLVR